MVIGDIVCKVVNWRIIVLGRVWFSSFLENKGTFEMFLLECGSVPKYYPLITRNSDFVCHLKESSNRIYI